jgi:hypothetical protein
MHAIVGQGTGRTLLAIRPTIHAGILVINKKIGKTVH